MYIISSAKYLLSSIITDAVIVMMKSQPLYDTTLNSVKVWGEDISVNMSTIFYCVKTRSKGQYISLTEGTFILIISWETSEVGVNHSN